MRAAIHACLLAPLLLVDQRAGAASLSFDIAARIDSSYLGRFDDPMAPEGAILSGRLSYDPAAARQRGYSHYLEPGTGEIGLWTAQGFSLTLAHRVAVVAPTASGDFFTAQSFVSESPNDWHIVMDLAAEGWLGGSTALPLGFPGRFESAYLTAYFTDEYEWVKVIDATVLSITPAAGPSAAVPLPLPLALLVGALAALAAPGRRRAD